MDLSFRIIHYYSNSINVHYRTRHQDNIPGSFLFSLFIYLFIETDKQTNISLMQVYNVDLTTQINIPKTQKTLSVKMKPT